MQSARQPERTQVSPRVAANAPTRCAIRQRGCGVAGSLILWLVVTLVCLPDQSRTWLRPLFGANLLMSLLVASTRPASICEARGHLRERT